MKKRTAGYLAASLAAVAALWTLPAGAAEDLKARSWAASCAACHGTDGQSSGEIPALAGKKKSELLKALQEFKAGQRPAATVMHQHAKGYTDEQLERLAEYFAQQKKP